MTAEDIRERYGETVASGTQQEWYAMYTMILLGEIAAQMAELNDKIAILLDPSKGITVSLAATNDEIPVRLRP
jgi:hypothetical protein